MDPQYTVTRSGDRTPVQEGEEVLVDRNLPATYLGIAAPPWGDDEAGEWFPGKVRVRYSWGETAEVDDDRAGLTVNEV
jgi:hypothetical protein